MPGLGGPQAPVLVVDLADPADARWPAYGPAMLAHEIRGVYAMPVVVAGGMSARWTCSDASPGAWGPSSWPAR